MLAADSLTGEVALHLVQRQRERQTLLPGHLRMTRDLRVQRRCRSHEISDSPTANH